MEPRLSLRIAQRLVLTPTLQQAIRLLQYSRQELVQYIRQELVENPTLEEVRPELISPQESAPAAGERDAPVTVSNRSGLVVRGHGRLMAAERLGLEAVPVDFQDYASEADEWTDLLADNYSAELAVIDETILKDLLQDIDSAGADLGLTTIEIEKIE